MAGAGGLRNRLTFQKVAEAGDDGFGNSQTGWAAIFGPVAARITPVRSRESLISGVEQFAAVFLLEIRSDPDAALINAKSRAVDPDTGAIYQITGEPLNHDEHGRYLRIPARKGAPDG